MFEIVQVERESEDVASRLGRKTVGAVLALLGVGILLLFLRALLTEVMDGTFFGTCICLLILTFGALVTRDGIALASDRRIQLKPWE